MSGIPSWAVKGAKVVCISTEWPSDYPMPELIPDPQKGETYRIAFVELDQTMDSGVGVRLIGFNPDDLYCLGNFRPLVTLEDDIATHFQHHLHHTAPALLEPAE